MYDAYITVPRPFYDNAKLNNTSMISWLGTHVISWLGTNVISWLDTPSETFHQ